MRCLKDYELEILAQEFTSPGHNDWRYFESEVESLRKYFNKHIHEDNCTNCKSSCKSKYDNLIRKWMKKDLKWGKQ